jgi:DNA polymerase I
VVKKKVLERTTLLVDATFLLKQSYLGADNIFMFGKKIGGLYQFMTMLRKLIRELNINKVVLCWDGENGGKMRHAIYSDYKGNRSGKSWYNKITLTEGELKREEENRQSMLAQKVRIQQYVEELFIRQIEVDQIEADDLIAFYVQNKCGDEKIIIYTNDRDLCQLLNYDNTNIYLANKKVLINKNNYFLFFKHHYQNLLLIKTMVGDNSDNIKGVKGLAEQTLLTHFPEIKNEPLTFEYIRKKAKEINEERKNNKQSPLIVMENIINGTIKNGKKDEDMGIELYRLNKKIIDLTRPFLTKDAKKELLNTANNKLSSDDRGSKNLMKMMNEDGFLQIFKSDFVKYVEPFYPVILKEKG